MRKPKILVTGANGQLGSEIRMLANSFPEFEFIFLSRQDLSIDSTAEVNNYFAQAKPQYCINCAAYTAVDKAETERDIAFLINGDSTGVIASACSISGTHLIHISTDYVFNGTATSPYKEEDPVEPINTYGDSKLKGEVLATANNPNTIIIRTSWVYSEFGNNFVKTMIRLMNQKDTLSVVSDQIGSPTYAADLAECILKIIQSERWVPGIYHYSNNGDISWYDFAIGIKKFIPKNCIITPIPTERYPTPAKRPGYSVFNKEKIQKIYNTQIPGWEESLEVCMKKIIGLKKPTT